jgi:hypothetical protein
MKFLITATDDEFYEKNPPKLELERAGFKFKPTTVTKYGFTHYELIPEEREISTLEELLDLLNQFKGHGLILFANDQGYTIEIYNGYRE